jgi:ATP-dependent 26S proteasome regulatory subunit
MERMMRGLILCALVMLSAMVPYIGSASAADSQKDKKPGLLGEPLPQEIVGTVVKIEGKHYVIKDKDGKKHRVHVDRRTKRDKISKGDKVSAYVTTKGHVTTLSRLKE